MPLQISPCHIGHLLPAPRTRTYFNLTASPSFTNIQLILNALNVFYLQHSFVLQSTVTSVDNSIKIQPVLHAYFARIQTARIRACTYCNLTLVIRTGRILIWPVLQLKLRPICLIFKVLLMKTLQSLVQIVLRSSNIPTMLESEQFGAPNSSVIDNSQSFTSFLGKKKGQGRTSLVWNHTTIGRT
jgi:hypothetical protein